MVFEHQHGYPSQWAAMRSIAEKIGCTTQTLCNWVRRTERDQGRRAGVTTDERDRMKELERENRGLRLADRLGCFAGIDLLPPWGLVDMLVRQHLPEQRARLGGLEAGQEVQRCEELGWERNQVPH